MSSAFSSGFSGSVAGAREVGEGVDGEVECVEAEGFAGGVAAFAVDADDGDGESGGGEVSGVGGSVHADLSDGLVGLCLLEGVDEPLDGGCAGVAGDGDAMVDELEVIESGDGADAFGDALFVTGGGVAAVEGDGGGVGDLVVGGAGAEDAGGAGVVPGVVGSCAKR